MKEKPNLFSFSNNLDSLLAAVAGYFLILIFTKHSGIGVSPDSVTYLSAARHMVSGLGFTSFENLPVVDFPFAYPFILTIISFFTRQDPLVFTPYLNGILFAILLYVSGALMNGFQLSSGWYKRILLACILMSPALQELYSMLWSETVFLLIILFFIYCFSRYLREMTVRRLLIPVLICALACITRYAGIFLVPAGLALIILNLEMPVRKRIMHCLIFGALSVSLFAINVLRNFLLSGFPMGQRPKNATGVKPVFENFGGVLCDWLLIDRSPGLAISLSVGVLAIFALTILYFYRRNHSSPGFEYVMAVCGLSYGVFMIFTSTITRYEQFTNRLLSPMFVPMLWSFSWWIPRFISAKSFRLKWVFGITALFLAAWFLDIQLRADYEFYDGVKDAGVPGYREDSFVQSEIVRFVEKYASGFDPRLPIYSNAGDAVYFITGLSARQLPFTAFPNKVRQYYAIKNSYLVWFRDLDNPEMPALDSLTKNKNLQLLKVLPDGAVYVSK